MSDSYGSEQEKSPTAKREEEILEFWRKHNIFQKTLEQDSPEGEFVFYDGPPFATGTPHYGHILAGTIKDVIPRFRTMQGYHVERQWGWDCHGLPLENKVEEYLGLKTKKDIVEYGVSEFNEAAKEFVLRRADDWKRIVPRTGRWVDMEHDYRTMDADYTESVWWAFSQLAEKDLIYEGFKSMQICPRCETPLSNFEVNQGYHEQKDIAVTVKLPLVDKPDTNLLVWTTTPWTLPGNMAVGVNPELDYVKVSHEEENYVVAEDMVAEVFEDGEHEITDEFSGADLVGKNYQPPFDYFKDKDIEGKENAWQVYAADFVTLEEGTGLVHLAPAFGADDLALAEKEDVPIVHHVTESGEFTEDVADFAGMKVKPRDEGDEEHLLADIEILKHLKERELLFAKENVHHQYPLCWRCDTPLLNYATNSWFVEVSKFKDQLVAENKEVDWVPEAVGTNRFGNWLEGARDWAISRERFWGAPLPVWKSEDGETVEVIGSLGELKEKTRSTNRFFLVRHGESVNNRKKIISGLAKNDPGLTDKGRKQTVKAAKKLEQEEIDLIITSPLPRTRETAELMAEELGLSGGEIVEDDRIRENEFGELEGATHEEYYEFHTSRQDRFDLAPEGGENWHDVKRRVTATLYDIDGKYDNKNILLVSHKGPIEMLQAGAQALDDKQAAEFAGDPDFGPDNAEVRELEFAPLPHSEDYELDLHRPYIDEITWENESGQTMRRVESVFDCWFESGSMPYASKHYPFATESGFNPETGDMYPANFVAEGLDQTRGWFYSSLVLGVGLFDQSPYENVIVNGLVMAEDGQKMSKSKGNYPPVDEVLDEQGADALRFFLINSPLVRGENVALSKDEIDEVVKKVMYRITNTYSFVEMYTKPNERRAARQMNVNSKHVLDHWILSRLDQLITQVTDGLESYQLDKAAKPITAFVDDLSTWYLRRSRDRIREEGEDRKQAIAVLLHVLEKLSLVLSPFMPFLAEELYQDTTTGEAKESVHLEDWPRPVHDAANASTVLENMKTVREVASRAHDLRSQHGLKVRQPLASLTLQDNNLAGRDEFLDILADEINVKEIYFDTDIENVVELDTEITDELAREGTVRELIRQIQRLRKKADLDPTAEKTITIDTDQQGEKLIKEYEDEITETATLSEISFGKVTEGNTVDIHEFSFTVKLSE